MNVNPKPAMCVGPVPDRVLELQSELKPPVISPDLQSYVPFISDGYVSLVGSDEKVKIKILRDTAAFDSFIIESALPFLQGSYTGAFIPVLGNGLQVLQVPQHKMMLSCGLFQGEVTVAVRPALPMDGVMMILGNDIAGSRVWADVPPPAIVASAPLVT